jgi:cytochrome c biogenesis protein CcmG, thiol:disulfide interchange protein DsbE
LIVATSLALALSHPVSRGRRAPSLPTTALVGAPVTLSSVQGRPALVDFFASWCEPCVGEAPALEHVARALRGRATVVGVDWSDSRRDALQFVARFRWTFPVLSDSNGVSGNAHGIEGLPTAFVLNNRGHIVKRMLGPQTTTTLLQALTDASRR